MSDTYQAVFDAVRSRISGFDGERLIEEIASRFDFSFYANQLQQDAFYVLYEQQRPSTIYRPTLTIDGNQWCALYGDDLMSGVAGFGNSPAKAMIDFDQNWIKGLK